MEIGELLSFYRKQSGLTIDELADKSGVPKGTINKIIGGVTKAPTLPNMKAIAKALGKTLADFDDLPILKTKNAPLYSNEALQLAKDYDGLDLWGQKQVRSTADIEKARCDNTSAAPAAEKVIELYPTRKYLQSASAGYGDFNDDASYEIIDLVKRPPAGASFVITVNGDSMEPTYHHGDLLFVRAQETINIGEIGLFVKGAHLYIKESGAGGLISHNQNGDYPLITPDDDAPILTEGKIVGVCTPDYLQ